MILGNDAYFERWEGDNPPDDGAGATREADATLDLAGTEPLLRRLLGKPEVLKHTRNLVPALPTCHPDL